MSEENQFEELKSLIEGQNRKIEDLEQLVKDSAQEDAVSILVFSNDLDKALSAFIIATGAASLGLKVNMFFTFWGTTILRKKETNLKGKSIKEKLFNIMLPNGSKKLNLSQLHMMGAGTAMMKSIMKDKNITNLQDLIDMVTEMDVNIQICEMTLGMMGMSMDDMVCEGNDKVCGVANYLQGALNAKVTLFI
jgi:peroxiredoxin family protein